MESLSKETYTSFDGISLSLGQEVFQISVEKDYRTTIHSYTIKELLPDNKIKIVSQLNREKIVSSKEVHTNRLGLLDLWINGDTNMLSLLVIKIYNMLTLKRQLGGEVSDELMAKFAPKDVVI